MSSLSDPESSDFSYYTKWSDASLKGEYPIVHKYSYELDPPKNLPNKLMTFDDLIDTLIDEAENGMNE